MANNKIQLADGTVLLDLTGDTVSPSTLMVGVTAHNAAGEAIVGEATGGGGGGEYNVISIDNGDGTQDIEITDAEGAISVVPLTATENKTYTAPSGQAYSPVTVNVPIPAPKLQAKSATPTESQQTITADSGYDGLSSVSVGAIPSNYIGSDVRVQTFYTGTATPTAAQGNDGDIYLKVVT